jgi:hypothetical protein
LPAPTGLASLPLSSSDAPNAHDHNDPSFPSPLPSEVPAAPAPLFPRSLAAAVARRASAAASSAGGAAAACRLRSLQGLRQPGDFGFRFRDGRFRGRSLGLRCARLGFRAFGRRARFPRLRHLLGGGGAAARLLPLPRAPPPERLPRRRPPRGQPRAHRGVLPRRASPLPSPPPPPRWPRPPLAPSPRSACWRLSAARTPRLRIARVTAPRFP